MRRLFRFVSCDGVSTVGWGVTEGLDTSGVELNVVGFGEMLGRFSFGVTSKEFSGVVRTFLMLKNTVCLFVPEKYCS